jgi:hypothetical protein
MKRFAAALIATVSLMVLCHGAHAQRSTEPQVYTLRMMGALRISIPVPGPDTQVMYRNADQTWTRVATDPDAGVATVDLSPSETPNGRTLLMVGAPRGVNLNDATPPHCVDIAIDGTHYGPVEVVELGGVDGLPKTITLELADDQSMLRRSTLKVAVNGRSFGLRDPGVEYDALGSRHARVVLDLETLAGEATRSNTVAVSVDDYALDDTSLDCLISFTLEPPRVLEDGTIARVDSVTSSAGWAEWWVIFDGLRMDASGGTTAGKTWLSAGNDKPHWLRLDFPAPRTISEVAIAWAYWESYRTSSRYELQALVNGKWNSIIEVTPEASTQESVHAFEPIETSSLRLWQPAMAGNSAEPQYLWISEFEVR